MANPYESGQVEHREPVSRFEPAEKTSVKAAEPAKSSKATLRTGREWIESLHELLTSEDPGAVQARHVLARAQAAVTADLTQTDVARVTRALRDFDALAR